jgi:hypothetical protein
MDSTSDAPVAAAGSPRERALAELARAQPDYAKVQALALLTIEETLSAGVAELGVLAEQIRLSSRHR